MGKSFPVVRYESATASIAVLLTAGSPPTITRLVVTAAVFAVDGVRLAGPWPHVFIECVE